MPATSPSPEPAAALAGRRVALLGNPNTGKTTLFNVLCGARAKTSNFPGTTTSFRLGHCELGGGKVDVVDLPGIYDLRYSSPETRIVEGVFEGRTTAAPDAVVVVVDACNLTRNLVLVGELLNFGRPAVVALNMVDLAEGRGLTVDAERLARRLNVPVVPTVARTGQGVDAVRRAVVEALGSAAGERPPDLPPRGSSTEAMTAWAERLVADVASGRDAGGHVDRRTERLDRVFTHPVLGMLSFAAVMAFLFWTLFTLATVPMDLIEATLVGLGDLIRGAMAEGPVRDLLTDGIVGGIAGTVVFLPQICLLFFFISLLEDTGYLARAAFVMDRLLSRFGLPGYAFVPLLTAHACALPGIMSTRLIPDRRDRLATILVAPFMSCSARLPVYVLLTSLLVADRPGIAALVFVGCYGLGATAAMLSAVVFGRTLLKGRARPMVLELPTYKAPSLANAVITAKDQGLAFLKTAGTVIVAICIVMWWLSAYPKVDTTDPRVAQQGSYAGQLGRVFEPVFRPLGFDEQLTIGVLTSFLAREVFVSTMSVLVGGGGDAEVDEGVIQRIRTMTRADGSLVFTTATSAAALVFFVLAMQCLPTLAVTRRETGALKYALLQLTYMSSLAYVVALAVYQGLRLAGVT